MKKRQSPVFRFTGYLRWVALAVLLGSGPALLNLLVDPYELVFERNRSGRTAEIAEKAHYPLWKLGKYTPGAYDTVVLGDSRARALREKYWRSLKFSPTKNLAYGGGTIPEIYETFKLVRDDPALKNLVIGIQLRSFDEDHKQGMNRVPEAIKLINSPVKYVFNWSVAKTSWNVFAADQLPILKLISRFEFGVTSAHATDVGRALSVGNSGMLVMRESRDLKSNSSANDLPKKFARQVKQNARSDWRRFQVSKTYWSYIEHIGQWAKDNDKNLVFVIPPTIAEMQQTIIDYGLSNENGEMRERLARWGVVLDFDYPDMLTKNLANFSDAYHFNAQVARQIVGEVVSQLTMEKSVRLRVEKRRQSVRCGGVGNFVRKQEKGSEVWMLPGNNCRVWGRTES